MKKKVLLILVLSLFIKFTYSQRRSSYNYLLTISYGEGVRASTYGLSFYKYRKDNRGEWIFPQVLSINNWVFRSDFINKLNYKSVNISCFAPGIIAFRQIKKNYYYNLGINIPIGTEELEDFEGYKTDNFLVGIKPTQGITFIPKSNFGITFSIGLYEQLLTSAFYNWDIGLKAELGFKF